MRLASIILLFSISMLMMPFYSIQAEQPEFLIPNQFLIKLNAGVSIQDFADEYNIQPLFRYEHALNGLTIQAPPGIMNKIRIDTRVEMIQQDQQVFITAQVLPTGLDRIDAELNPLAKN